MKYTRNDIQIGLKLQWRDYNKVIENKEYHISKIENETVTVSWDTGDCTYTLNNLVQHLNDDVCVTKNTPIYEIY